VGFGQGVGGWSYALTSCRSVALYLNLAVWPHPLVFDYGYGTTVVSKASAIAPQALVLAALLLGTAVALWQWPTVGFAGAWFFVILAPTSSVVPIVKQPIAESRLYLSLAAVVGLVVLGLYRWIGRRSLILLAVTAVGLGWLTIQRNEDYRSALSLWSDTVAKQPENARARNDLGLALKNTPGRMLDAIAQFDAALRLKPNYAEAYNNLGVVLTKTPGRLADALPQLETAVRIKPDYPEAHNNLGVALIQTPGRMSDAIAQLETAVHLNPNYAEAHNNLGVALATIPGRLPEAMVHYQAALKINPYFMEAHYNLGNALARQRLYPAACHEYEETVRLKADFVDGHVGWGVALLNVGELNEAAAQFETALRLKPGYSLAQKNLDLAKDLLFKSRPNDSSGRPAP
ncbi:MAG: tetratricopeptide repeat protein, partial [Opitutaceae bacterium]